MAIQIPDAKVSHYTFPEKFELQFYKIFRVLKNLGCDYLYFLGIDDQGMSHRFCTHEDWIHFYRDEKFGFNDPLKRAVENTPFIILPWQQVSFLYGGEKMTMQGRLSFGLFNGLSLVRDYKNRKYIFALATESKEHDFARYVLLEKIGELEKIVCDCMRLFDQYLMLMDGSIGQIM